jgi:hypothetical protein
MICACGRPIPEERVQRLQDRGEPVRCIQCRHFEYLRNRHHPDDPRGEGFPPAPNLYEND